MIRVKVEAPYKWLCSELTEQVLLKSYREQLGFLTRKHPLVAEKIVHAKLGENVSFI